MVREVVRRGAASPSPLSSPTPSAVAAFALRKDPSSPFAPSASIRDGASPLSASHASLTTDPVHATLSPRPMSPTAYAATTSFHHAADAHFTSAAPTKQSSGQPQLSTRSSAPTSSTLSSTDRASERAFYRRILFQDLTPSTQAPAITHDVDLDHEIYLLLAYLLRETVLPWYSKLTPDREFLTQITAVISSVIHTVVQRQTSGATNTSLAAACFDGDIHAQRSAPAAELPRIHDLLSRDIPLILRQHCSDFRQAHAKADTIWAPLGTQHSSLATASSASQADSDEQRRQRVYERLPTNYQEVLNSVSTTNTLSALPLRVAQLYHAASPHPGLDPITGSLDGKIRLAYLRIAVLNLLSSLLPADEYAPDTEKFIVRDVLVTVLRGALAKSFRPWFFVQILHKALDAAGWPSNAAFQSAQTVGSMQVESTPTSVPTSTSPDGTSTVIALLTRLPAILLQAWTLIVFTALPFLIRAYLDIFNVQRAASRKKQKQQQQHHPKQEDVASHDRSSSQKGTFPSSLSTGSLVERQMHGRFPSRKFHYSHDDTLSAQGCSSAVDDNLTLRLTELAGVQGISGEEEAEASSNEDLTGAGLPPNYVGNWLDAAEEMLQVSSHRVLRAVLSMARTILGTTGLDEAVNRVAMLRINAELRDTQKLTRIVRELRRILLPDGHLPPSVPDPDVEAQEAEWIRLRTRLVCAAAHSSSLAQKSIDGDAFVPWLFKKVLLGSSDTCLHRGDRASRTLDTQIQLQRLTGWLEPFCSPQAAGPNTLLAILVFERVIVALCPDLTLP